MPFKEGIRALLGDVATILNILVIDEYEADSLWHVALDAETMFFAEIDHQRGLLVLSSDAGSPVSSNRLELYEKILNYNHHWDKTIGARLSLLSPSGVVWLWSEFAISQLDRDRMAAWFDDYGKKVRAWRSIVSQSERGEGRREETSDFFASKGFIRG